MKAIIVSDTHKNGENIKKIVEYAKKKKISCVLDAGDLHGEISSYDGIKLHAVYWRNASGAMDEWDFRRGVEEIGGTVRGHGSSFVLNGIPIFMQHNLAEYNKDLPKEKLSGAQAVLEE
ncbi:MAG: metallophosphoesterase family protein, partial [Nanoarchaeota archaeon]